MNKSELIQVRIDAESKKTFLKLCKKKGVTPSEALRILIFEKLGKVKF